MLVRADDRARPFGRRPDRHAGDDRPGRGPDGQPVPDRRRDDAKGREEDEGVLPRRLTEHRADAHVLIAFLAYCLQVTLKNRLMIHAPGLTPAAVLEKLATIQMVEVWIPMLDGRWLVLPRHTQPEPDVQALLEQIRITLPPQPPPRIKSSQLPTVGRAQPALPQEPAVLRRRQRSHRSPRRCC